MVVGDLRDPASVRAALDGVDGVFLIIPAFAPDSAALGTGVVAAAQAAGVRRLVFSGVYHPSLSLVNHASMRPVEESVYRSELEFTILQPAMFMQGLLGGWQSAVEHGVFVMPYSKDSAMTFVDYRDVAEAAAIAFTTDDLVNGTFELAAGGMVTRTELAALMTRYAGREVTAQDADPGTALRGCPSVPEGRPARDVRRLHRPRVPRRQQPGSAHHPRPYPALAGRLLRRTRPLTANRTSHHEESTMPDQPNPIPPDDLSRRLTIARPDDDQSLPHIGLVGDTYTILVAGQDTAGKYTLIDMHVPPGGGPPPHRHDFEEMFTVLDGEVRVTFRGQTITARAGETINVPANAPHSFTNAPDTPSRLLCMCAPAGQEEFFTLVGQPVATRTEAPPPLSPDAQAAFIARSREPRPSVQDRAAAAARPRVGGIRRRDGGPAGEK